MNMFKKLGFSVGMSVVLLLAACGEENSGAEEADSGNGGDAEKTIGVSISNLDEFLTYMQEAMIAEGESHPDFEFVFSDAQNEGATQLDQVENFISRDVDAIVLHPVDTVSAVDIVDRANDAGIPIVVANRTFEGIEAATAFVGSESIVSGTLQMEAVAELLDGEGNVAIMEGELGHEAQIMRTQGNLDIIKEYPGIEVVYQGTAIFSRSEGMQLMENWLNSGEEIDAVVANNDEMAIGAIMALEAEGKLDDVIVAGIDATPAALEYMQDGLLDVTVYQDAIGQGANSIKAAVSAANGEEVDDILVPYELVTPENVDEYMDKYDQ